MSGALPRAGHLLRAGDGDIATPGTETIDLDYDQRFLRRRRLVPSSGRAFLVDLPETTDLGDGDVLCLDDGRQVTIRAAAEPLTRVHPAGQASLARLAWHIGNRHTPCAIGADHLMIRRDPVLAAMLAGLGARLEDETAPFLPEGGAYGTGRTLGHSHGPEASHDHRHGDHDHAHDHEHHHG